MVSWHRKGRLFYIVAALLLAVSAGVQHGPQPAQAAGSPLVKPTGGMSIVLEPRAAVSAAGATAFADLRLAPERDVAQFDVSLATSGSARINGRNRLVLPALAAGQTDQIPVGYVVAGTGAGEVRATVTARDATGRIQVVKRDIVYVLASGAEVLQGTSGPLDLQLERLRRDRNAGKLDADAYQNAVEALLGGGATESNAPPTTAPQSSAPSAAGDLSISGQILWTDRNGGTHPVRSAPVEIRDDELVGSDLVTTVSTDANGNYAAVVNNDDGLFQGGRDIFVRVLASGPGFVIRNTSNDVQRIDSSIHSDLPDGAVLNISLTANNTADNNTAFSLQSALVTVNQYVQQVRGARFPDVNVVFPTNRSTSLFDGSSLHILQLDRFDWDVVHHEYGHYVQSQLHIANNPGGPHSLNENLAETRGKDSGIRLAWGEGWPTYFGTSLQQVLNTAALGVPNVGDTRYQDTEDATINYDLETQSGGASLGEDNELSVQRILWDIYDAGNDTGDTGVAFGDSSVWNMIDNADPTTFSAAYQALIAGRPIRDVAQIGCIVGEHRVAPSPSAPADRSAATLAPPVFQWNANGGGPSNRNNKFTVEFYDASFGTLLFAAPEQDPPSFTPSQAQWDDITSRAGSSINWLVKGRQTNTPATGTYTSCARRLDKADLRLTKICSPADTVPLGVPFTCTITVSNLGPGTQPDVSVQDTLTTAVDPANYSISAPTFSLGGGAPVPCTLAPPNQFTCAIGSLPVGITAVINVAITSNAAGLFTNQAQVVGGGIDPNAADNQASDSVTVIQTSDLSATKTVTPTLAAAGGSLVYALNVANAGPNSASQVRVVDQLPSGVIYAGASQACAQAPLGTVTCDLSDLQIGETRTISLTVLAQATAGGHSNGGTVITNTVTITNQAGLDPNLANNRAVATAIVVNNRVVNGLQALYTFDEGSGAIVHDISGVGSPLDLPVVDLAAVRWSPGGLVISATTLLASEVPAAKISAAISKTAELTLEAWIVPADAHQGSLARIVTLSNDPVRRNVELIQERTGGPETSQYTARLRTTDTPATGTPPLHTPKGSAKPVLQHVVYTRDALGITRLYINGVLRAKATTTGDLASWDASYRLVLANVLTGDRPWLGEYQLVALYNRALSPAEIRQNFRAGASGAALVAPVGVQARYTFDEGSGATVHDRAGGEPADLTIANTAAVHWTPGGLAIDAPTILATGVAATKVISAAIASNELTIEAWVAASTLPQNRQARILTLADANSRRDAELFQERDSKQQTMRYSVRLRTSATPSAGALSAQTPKRGVGSALQHVVYTRDALGVVRIYVDGLLQGVASSSGDFSTWDPSYQLGLGNTFAGDRPWLGEYQLVALYNRALSPAEVVARFRAGPSAAD